MAKKSNPTSEEWPLRWFRKAERGYSTFKVRRGDLVQGKKLMLHYARAAVKRYPPSKIRETPVRW